MSDKIAKGAIGVCLLAIVTLVIMCESEDSRDRAAGLVTRTEICANVCVSRESEWHRVWNQKIGFGSFEWRCGCKDGHVQAVP